MRTKITSLVLLGGLAFLFFIPSLSFAKGVNAPRHSDSAYDLINAVNALRLSNGLTAYSVNSILMYTAQNQADFMAANEIVTHSGPGGIGLTDRLLAAGYPLAGDLSLGGFRAENIISGLESMTAQAAINAWTGDAPHLNTMLSPNLTEIGAGVAVKNGHVYYVIDAARPTSSGAPQAVTQVSGGGSAVPANEAIAVVVVSTPNSDGNVIHEVFFGQTLWQIAITYGVKIDEIKQLNNLSGNDIYPGEKLLIQKGIFLNTETPTNLPTMTTTALPTSTPAPTLTVLPFTPTLAPTVEPVSGMKLPSIVGAVIGIVVLAVLIGMWFSRSGGDLNQ